MQLLLIIALMAPHENHETFSEVEWNAESERIEIALRLDTLDEQWLAKKHSAKQTIDKWAAEYLKSCFRFDGRKTLNTPTKDTYHWIGRKEDGAHVWWFFEVAPVAKSKPREITQAMLFGRDERFRNRILLADESGKRIVTTNYQKPTVPLERVKE